MARLLVLVLVPLALLCGAASVRVKPGEDATLKCQSGVNIGTVEWTRSDLVDPKYVLLYSNGNPDAANQDSRFSGRAQLVDEQLTTKDVSLILRSVSENDEGTYECRVIASRKKRGLIKGQPICTVQLKVSDSDDDNSGAPSSYTGLGTAVFLGLVCWTFSCLEI